MSDKFVEFKWNCWEDVKPEPGRYVYTYFSEDDREVDICVSDDVFWEDTDYWIYVYIPIAPRVEKKMTLEERIDYLENGIDKLNSLVGGIISKL